MYCNLCIMYTHTMYNFTFEMAKLAKRCDEADSELDWIEVEQKLASSFHHFTLLWR